MSGFPFQVLGIDPGLNGALAVYHPAMDDWNETMSTYRIPTMKAPTRGRVVNWSLLIEEFGLDIECANHVFIELVGARPGQGVSSMFKFGYVAGGLRGIVAVYAKPLTMVTPQKWKKELGLGPSKDAAKRRAAELMPKFAREFSHEGVAEAALIAYYGWHQLQEKSDG